MKLSSIDGSGPDPRETIDVNIEAANRRVNAIEHLWSGVTNFQRGQFVTELVDLTHLLDQVTGEGVARANFVQRRIQRVLQHHRD